MYIICLLSCNTYILIRIIVRDDHVELVAAQSLREPKMKAIKSRALWATEGDGPPLKELPYGPRQTLAYAAWQLAPAYGVADVNTFSSLLFDLPSD